MNHEVVVIGHHGIAEVANASGLGRESLYKALAPGARKVLDSLGVKLTIAV
jgi:DNA-binding phage protein